MAMLVDLIEFNSTAIIDRWRELQKFINQNQRSAFNNFISNGDNSKEKQIDGVTSKCSITSTKDSQIEEKSCFL